MIPISTITLEEYLADPCGVSSLPYWKSKTVTVPEWMAIVHDRDFQAADWSGFEDTAYFRLIHDLKSVNVPALPDGFSLCRISTAEYARHICSCYDGIGVTEAELEGYKKRPVHEESLWLAIREAESGSIAATAIGELDPETGEGSLEWVQVSQPFRGLGLGRFLVSELLRRMQGKADFATVSGQCGNPTNPESLYRRCGFTGHDVWHILRKKEL